MKKYLILIVFFITGMSGFCCTTFLLKKNGELLFGRNYDWVTGAGIVHTNQRGLLKTSSVSNEKSLGWVSLYGSITFNQYGKEFPTGGMNEKGLVVEMMWLDGTQYAQPDQRPAIEVLQWIQYQLDLHSTVAEIIQSEKDIRISRDATPIHFLVADAEGNAATIEFLDGKMVVHKDASLPFPVLTNDTYSNSITATGKAIKNNSMPADNSLNRFVKVCRMLNDIKTLPADRSPRDYAFEMLDHVAQGEYTKWSIVYDIKNKKVYFKTADFKTVKSFSFSSFDFKCSSTSKMFNMNQAGSGDISAHFILPDKKIKLEIVSKAVKESSQRVTISDAEKKMLIEFEERITCK